MSGGYFDYASRRFNIFLGEMEDEKLNDMIVDFAQVLHKLEWYKSGDISKKEYDKVKEEFKEFWLK